jgi:hypothetical protein
MKLYFQSLLVVLMVAVTLTTYQHLWAQEAPKADCATDLEKLRAYSNFLISDRNQKEAAAIELDRQVRGLQAEVARLRDAAPKK